MFWNGSTAMEGFSGDATGGADSCAAAGSPFVTKLPAGRRWARIGRAIFLSFCSPRSTKVSLRPVARQTPGVLREHDAARLADRLKAGGDIDAVAHEVAVAFLDHVAEMDADPELDPPVGRQAGVAPAHAVLHLDRASHRIHDAAELGENAVPGALDDPAMMGGDGGIDHVAAHRPDPRKRAFFVPAREAAIADHVGGEIAASFLVSVINLSWLALRP